MAYPVLIQARYSSCRPKSSMVNSTEQRAELLRSTIWCSIFNVEESMILAKYFEIRKVGKGAVLFEETSAERSLCVLVAGSISILKDTRKKGIRKTIAVVGAGYGFGEMSLLDGQPRSATAIVTEPSTLLQLKQDKFEHLCENDPKLAMRFIQRITTSLSLRLRDTSTMLSDRLAA